MATPNGLQRPWPRLAVVSVLLLSVASACAGATPSTPGPPSTTAPVTPTQPAQSPAATASATPASSGATPGSVIDLSGVDACTLLDEAAAKALTGVSLDFVNDQSDKLHCFWAIPVPGEPAYAELRISPYPGPLSSFGFSPGEGCTRAAVAGIGTEAEGGTCSSPQSKVYLLVWHQGVLVTLLVNEPERALTPADLADTVRTVFEGIRLP